MTGGWPVDGRWIAGGWLVDGWWTGRRRQPSAACPPLQSCDPGRNGRVMRGSSAAIAWVGCRLLCAPPPPNRATHDRVTHLFFTSIFRGTYGLRSVRYGYSWRTLE